MKPPGHRNLFNGDCNFFATDVYCAPGERFSVGVITRYIDTLVDNGVDTYLINVNGQMPWYPSKSLPHVITGYKRGDRAFVRGHYPPLATPELMDQQYDGGIREQVRMLDRYLDLVEDGVDWLDATSKHCRARNIAPWASFRMNDAHGGNSWEKSYMNCALQRDPKYRLSGRGINPSAPPSQYYQLLDYAHREVRDYMLAMIRDVVEDYDVDGVELDWMRCPFCCEPPATDAQRAMMLEWMAEVRALCRKHDLHLGMRLPVRLGLLRGIGLDVAEMAKRDLFDFASFTNFWQTSWDVPYDELRRSVGENVATYGMIEAAPNWLHTLAPGDGKPWFRLLPCSPELVRGNAAGKYAMGVDGIETFNYFCADETRHTNPGGPSHQASYEALADLHDLERLRGRPKQYVLATRKGYWMFPEFELADQVPFTLEPGTKEAVRLSMCAEPPDAKLRLIIQVITRATADAPPPPIGVSFNGSWPTFAATATDKLLFPCGPRTHHLPEHRAFNFAAGVRDIRDGWNEVLVFNSPATGEGAPVQVVGVELAVTEA